MLNLARLRFLSRAEGVLSIDIDELVHSTRGESIFDRVRSDRLGYVRFVSQWLDSDAPQAAVRHADHSIVHSDLRACPPKFCVRPSGPLGTLSWSVHDLEFWATRWIPISRRFRYDHCRRLTTDWKQGRRLKGASVL